MSKLDIIIPHYNESYDIVKPILQMLEVQRKTEYGDYRVLFINDGEEHHLSELDGYDPPYPFEERSIPHGGVSAVRNYGIEQSDAEWIMFCDCDDTFASVYSLHEILQGIGVQEGYDLLWCPYYFELPDIYDRHLVDEFELTFLHGKIFRREFLNEHKLRFNTELNYTEDTSFLHVAGMELNPHCIGKIQPNMPLYVYVRRERSVSNATSNIWRNSVGLFHGQIYLAEENFRRNRTDTYCSYVCRAMTDAYVALCRTDISEPRESLDREAWEFYRTRTEDFAKVPKEYVEKSIQRSILEFNISKETVQELPDFGVWLDGWTKVHRTEE